MKNCNCVLHVVGDYLNCGFVRICGQIFQTCVHWYKMPDYLGDDQRKTKAGDGDEEKIKCWCALIRYGNLEVSSYVYFFLIRFHTHHFSPLALDEGDIQILKTYVSTHCNF